MNNQTNPKHRTTAALKARGSGRRPPARGAHERPRAPAAANGELLQTRGGETLLLRPIHAGDVGALQRGFTHLSAAEVRMRFLHPLTELPEPLAQRLCNLDPHNEVALVLVDPCAADEAEIHAVARAHVDPVTLGAEFALVVQQRFAGQGLGTLLMGRLIEACRALGALQMWGDVLIENGAMLELCNELGFEQRSQLHDPGMLRVTLDLHGDDLNTPA